MAHVHVYDMRDYGGLVNDPAAGSANTSALIAALAALENNDPNPAEPYELFFASGDWHFDGPLPVNSHSDPTIFDNVSISGVYRAPSVQHEEEGPPVTNDRRDRTRFIINLNNESDIWWNQIRTYRFGPLAFRDISFQIANLGSLFAFGDPAEQTVESDVRGLKFERCYMSRVRHYGGGDIGNGDAWLLSGANSRGWVLNSTNQSFGLRMHKCYDVDLDLDVRGFKYGVINSYGDRVEGRLRGITLGKLLDEYNISGATAMVGSHWQSLYAENVYLAGAVLTGQVAQLRAEYGYDGQNIENGVPTTIARDLPAEIMWEIRPGEDFVRFTFPATDPVDLQPWGYDCLDYFEPRMCYKFTPTTANEPERWLYVTKVEATQLTFADHLSKSYVGRPLNGNGAGVLRTFATGYILDGDRASVIDASVGCNEVRTDSPRAFWRSERKPIKVGGNADGAGPNPVEPTNQPVVVASSVGATYDMQGGVDLLGSADVVHHPLVNPGGIGPAYDDSVREPIWNPDRRTQLYLPGRGVYSQNQGGRDLTFHYVEDTELGYKVPCYRPSDASAVGWQLPGVREVNVSTVYTARAWAIDDLRSIYIWGGAAEETRPLTVGWNTVRVEMPAWKQTSTMPFISQVGGDIYVAWVEVDQVNKTYAGVYTPTMTAIANLEELSLFDCHYQRVADIMYVSGYVSIVPTNPIAYSAFRISLPIPSNLGVAADCAGTAAGILVEPAWGMIEGDPSNNEALLQFISPSAVDGTSMSFHFSYRVI